MAVIRTLTRLPYAIASAVRKGASTAGMESRSKWAELRSVSGILYHYDGVAARALVDVANTQTLAGKILSMPRITGTVTLLANDGAVDISLGDIHAITKGSAAAITLAPPAAGDAGRIVRILSRSAFAHTITITEGIGGAGGGDDVITFTNRAAASIALFADNLHWYVAGAYLAAIA